MVIGYGSRITIVHFCKVISFLPDVCSKKRKKCFPTKKFQKEVKRSPSRHKIILVITKVTELLQ